jgi:protein subunit release factor A
MGKKVTYGIKYTRTVKVPETLKEHFDQYKALSEKGKKIEAAQTIIQITEWLLDESDLGEDPEDPEIIQHFPKAIEYCEKAIQLLEESGDTVLLPRYRNNEALMIRT